MHACRLLIYYFGPRYQHYQQGGTTLIRGWWGLYMAP
jgi:hypothetical protein